MARGDLGNVQQFSRTNKWPRKNSLFGFWALDQIVPAPQLHRFSSKLKGKITGHLCIWGLKNHAPRIPTVSCSLSLKTRAPSCSCGCCAQEGLMGAERVGFCEVETALARFVGDDSSGYFSIFLQVFGI